MTGNETADPATIKAMAEQRARDEELTRLRKAQHEAQQRLEATTEALQQAEDRDFHARLARMSIRGMTLKEKSETVARIGGEAYEKLIYEDAQRRR